MLKTQQQNNPLKITGQLKVMEIIICRQENGILHVAGI